MERAALDPHDEIRAGYRVFDLRTKPRSEAARKLGETWFDPVSDALARGVRMTIVLSDFDPVMAPDLHRAT